MTAPRSVGPRFAPKAFTGQKFCGWKGCDLEIPPTDDRCWKHKLNVLNTPEAVTRAVARACAVRVEDINGTRKTGAISLARKIAMYVLRRETNLSLTEIGAAFGGKHHTSVLAAVRKAARLVETDQRASAAFVAGMKAARKSQ
jgi:hypothetical protein